MKYSVLKIQCTEALRKHTNFTPTWDNGTPPALRMKDTYGFLSHIFLNKEYSSKQGPSGPPGSIPGVGALILNEIKYHIEPVPVRFS